jgi:hypothetical protein
MQTPSSLHATLALLLLAAAAIGCDSRGDQETPAPPPDAGSPERDGDGGIVGGRTFYVSSTGDDFASGLSIEEAWHTLGRITMHEYGPDDTVLLEGGARFEGSLKVPQIFDDLTDHPWRVGSYGEGRAVIDAADGDGILIEGLDHVVVEDLIITGDWDSERQTGNDGEGISAIRKGVSRPSNLQLRNLEISGFKHAGIGVHARPRDMAKNSGWNDVLIEDCEVHDNGDFGIVFDGPYVYDKPGYSHANVTVRRTRAHHNRGLKNKGEHTGSGIVLSDVDQGLIEYCVAHDNGEFNDHDGGGGFGIWAWDSDRITIQFNESYANKTRTSDGGGFDLDGGVTRSVMQFNYSHDNQGAGYGAFQFAYARPFSGNLIQYNISQNDGWAFLAWDGYGDMGSITYAQNVGYGKKPALATFSALKAATFVNNVFYGTGAKLLDVFDGSKLVLQGNAYWTGDAPFAIAWNTGSTGQKFSSFEQFRTATSAETLEGEATGVHADPRLLAAGDGPTFDDPDELGSLTMYELQDSSPLIDRGVDLQALGIDAASRDFFGRNTPQGVARDVGAHEAR